MRASTSIIFIAFLLMSNLVFGQVAKNTEVLQSKGHWKLPVKSYKSAFDNRHAAVRGEGVSFLTDSLFEVHAIYKGEVVAIANAGTESYSIVTRYGDYFITYDNLAKPSLTKGDFIQEGQTIGRIYGGPNETDPSFTIILELGKKSIPLANWFNWNTAHTTSFVK